MSKLAIQGLIAITTAVWLPPQAEATSRLPWGDEVDSVTRLSSGDAAENSLVLIRPSAPRDDHE